MLALYNNRGLDIQPPRDLVAAQMSGDVVWIDLLKPDAAEIAFVERTTKLPMPDREELSEIESSSRLRAEKDALYVNAPLIYRAESDEALATPVGFVLTAERLITIRFAELSSFAALAKRQPAPDAPALSSGAIFSDLIEAIVDRLADVLERIAAQPSKVPVSEFSFGVSVTTAISSQRSATACSGSAGSFPLC
jgi:magnesium transporter